MPHHVAKKTENISFSEELTARHGGETLKSCYQCGTCASSCPVARLDSNFNPREVIKLALLGEKNEVVSGSRQGHDQAQHRSKQRPQPADYEGSK